MNEESFQVGDTLRVFSRDPQEKKAHSSPFEGVVIAIRGLGQNSTFTVRRIGIDKIAIERIFPFNSPAIEKIKVVKKNKVKRAKLYYLRKK